MFRHICCFSLFFAALIPSPGFAQTDMLFDTPHTMRPVAHDTPSIAQPTSLAPPVQIVQPVAPVQAAAPPAPSTPPVVASNVQQAQIRGITNTLLEYPQQAPQILNSYVGIDTTKINFDVFMDLVYNGTYQEIYNEVATLYTNSAAFNSGALTNLSYYKVAAPVAVAPAATVAPATTPAAAAATKSAAGAGYLSTPAFYGSVALVTAGVAGTVAVFGAGGGDGDGLGNGNANDPDDDVFDRAALPDLFDPNDFVDAEFNDAPLDALALSNAQYAYAKGLTGAGVNIGFYDFFSDDSSLDAEVNARIIYRDLDLAADTAFMAADCALDPGNPYLCNHGGVVMGVAGNARDGVGTQGVAYQANLMMSSVMGTVNARDLADSGADIINFSCGGCATFNDLEYIADEGVLMTSATGNDGGANPSLDSPARFASLFDYQLIAVTGAYVSGGVLSAAAYDKCGLQQEYCMTALSDSGTSFAAPQVAGAAALIKDGWSFLTANEIGQILLYSAQDIGAPGVDAVFGHGLLDIQAAVEPIGTLSALSGNSAFVNFTPSVISQNQVTAFGDAFSNTKNAKGNVVVVDSFGRDFSIKTKDNLVVAQQRNFTPQMMQSFGSKRNDFKTMTVNDRLSMKFTNQPTENGTDAMVGFAEYDVAGGTKLTLGFTTDIDTLTQNDMQPFNSADFISRDSFKNGFMNFSDNNQVYYQAVETTPMKNIKTKFSAYYSKNGDVDYFKPISNQVTNDYTSTIAETIISPSDNLDINVKNGVTHEFDSVLGTKFSGSFDMEGGANTYFTGVDVSYDVMPNVNIFGSYLFGTTQATPSQRSAFNNVSDILSDSFSVTATRSELVGHDKLSVSVGQPTRVRSGTASGLTQHVNRTTGDVSVAEFQQDLTPSGRTLTFQAAYQKELSDDVDMNFAVQYTRQPYQQLEAEPEASALVKFTYRFN